VIVRVARPVSKRRTAATSLTRTRAQLGFDPTTMVTADRGSAQTCLLILAAVGVVACLLLTLPPFSDGCQLEIGRF
jgi:hypothetical protein